jgi:RNA polymerase sigma-70 factor (ECF subfamily)
MTNTSRKWGNDNAFDVDARLMARLRNGDADALDRLMDRHWGHIVAYLERTADVPDVAQDIAQDVFLRLWQQRVDWQPIGSLRSFLFSVARHLLLNQDKRRWREVRHLPSYRAELERRNQETPGESLERAELRAAVDRAVASLPRGRREVFVLARIHGLSYKEIADVMEISPQTVANQLSAAVAELRGMLRVLLEP